MREKNLKNFIFENAKKRTDVNNNLKQIENFLSTLQDYKSKIDNLNRPMLDNLINKIVVDDIDPVQKTFDNDTIPKVHIYFNEIGLIDDIDDYDE